MGSGKTTVARLLARRLLIAQQSLSEQLRSAQAASIRRRHAAGRAPKDAVPGPTDQEADAERRTLRLDRLLRVIAKRLNTSVPCVIEGFPRHPASFASACNMLQPTHFLFLTATEAIRSQRIETRARRSDTADKIAARRRVEAVYLPELERLARASGLPVAAIDTTTLDPLDVVTACVSNLSLATRDPFADVG